MWCFMGELINHLFIFPEVHRSAAGFFWESLFVARFSPPGLSSPPFLSETFLFRGLPHPRPLLPTPEPAGVGGSRHLERGTGDTPPVWTWARRQGGVGISKKGRVLGEWDSGHGEGFWALALVFSGRPWHPHLTTHLWPTLT